MRPALLAVPLFAALAFPQDRAFAQDPFTATITPRPEPPTVMKGIDYPVANLRVDVPLVLIPVQVTTAFGASVTNLSRDNFRLFEDDTEQKIVNFGREDAPTSIGILFDASGSMRNKIQKSSEAAAALLRTANPEDEFFLVEFNERARLKIPFTGDPSAIYHQIARTDAIGRTALLDAIRLGLVEMKKARNSRHALVVFSDGGDNHSRRTETEIRSALRESDVQVYSLGIFENPHKVKLSREELKGPGLLSDLADQSGGRHYTVDNLDDLPALCARLGDEMRSQYLLGYSPSNPARDGKWRRVRVVLATQKSSAMRLSFRQGYYAPAK